MMAAARPPSLAIDISDDVSKGSPRSGLAFEIEMEGQGSPIPKGLEKRLAERSEIGRPGRHEEIDHKLNLAEKRRKDFLDWLSNKAKPKQKGPSIASFSSEELAAKLEARLSAAEAKRTELLARDQDRLAAYFASHEKRLARLQGSTERCWDATWQRLAKAEERRAALLEAERVKAAERYLQAREVARSVVEARDQDARALQERLEEKLVRASTRRQQLQLERGSLNLKRRASHGERLSRKLARHWKAFLQQNKTTAQLAEEFQACDVSQETATKLPFERFAGSITSAKTVKAAKELLARLETRLLLSHGKHKGTTVEHLLRRLSEASRPRRSPSPSPVSSPRVHSHLPRGPSLSSPHGVRNSPSGVRKSPKGPSSGVNTPGGGSTPGGGNIPGGGENTPGGVNTPGGGNTPSGGNAPSGVNTPGGGNTPSGVNAPTERYPARVFLCAFMILGHQEAVFNERGPREAALTEASKRLVPLFEELVTRIVERSFDSGGSSPRESYDGPALKPSPQRKRFGDQLKEFDSVWLHYLDQFVAWKVKDLSSLEGDLIKVALQLESSMHQYCKALHGEEAPHLTPDQEAIRVQVASDQGLLRERVNRLTGEEGLERMEAALGNLRASFLEQRARANAGEALDVPVEIVHIDALGNRIEAPPETDDVSKDGKSDVSDDVSTEVGDVTKGNIAKGGPIVGGLSAAFGGKGSEVQGGSSSTDRTPPARSGRSSFGFTFPGVRKPAPLEVPDDRPNGGATLGSSRGSSKSPVARQLFANGAEEIGEERYAPLFSLGKLPIYTPVSANERLPAVSGSAVNKPRGLENIHMVHELMYDASWQLTSTPGIATSAAETATSAGVKEPDPDDPFDAVQKQLGVAMERAFWDSVKDGLAANPPDWARVVGLVAEVRGELEGLVPNAWKAELAERMDTELLQQVLENSAEIDFAHLLSLLHYAADVMIRLGAPARDAEAKTSLQTLLTELQSGTDRAQAPGTVVKGLRYLFERLRVLKRDVSNARLRVLAPMLQGNAGVDYERRWFVQRYPNLEKDPHAALPKTATWLADVSSDVAGARLEHEAAVEAATAAGLPGPVTAPLPVMRSGLARVTTPITGPSTMPASAEISKPLDWSAPSALVKLGLLKLVPLTQGVTEVALPETLELDVGRIREAQDRYQRILVTVTGLLLTRQVLASKGLKAGAAVEGVIETAHKGLANLLENPKANLASVGKLLAEAIGGAIVSEEWDDVGEKQMTSLMAKSTKPDDQIFVLVGKVLLSALRGAVFGGEKTPLGKALTSGALKRAGAIMLTEDVLGLAERIGKLADVNSRVHGVWYGQLLVDEI